MDTKRCSRCGEQLPLDMFYPIKNRKAGYSSQCKKCVSESRGRNYTPREKWPEGFRACTKCKQIKALEEFFQTKKGRFGRDSVCRSCSSTAKPKPQAREGYRFCTQCGEEKSATIENFPPSKKSKTGIDARCRVCARINAKKWHDQKMIEDPDYNRRLYWKDHEKSLQRSRASYRRNIATYRAYSIRKYHENIEESRRKNREEYYGKRQQQTIENVRKWRQRNPERYREYNRQWAEENPEKYKMMIQAKDQRRRARKRNLPSDFSMEDWRYCLDYWEGKCAVCGESEELHADHWIALSNGNTLGTVSENMIVLCSHCNRTKHATEPKVWLIRKLGEEAGLAKLAEIEAYFQHVQERKL